MGWLGGAGKCVCVEGSSRPIASKDDATIVGSRGVSPSAPIGFFDPRREGGERRRIVGIFAPGPTGAKTTQQR